VNTAGREAIVDEIVVNLRPWVRDEQFAAEQTRRCIETLEALSKADEKMPLPSDAKKKRLKFQRALAGCIAAAEQMPAGAFDTYTHLSRIDLRRFASFVAEVAPGSKPWKTLDGILPVVPFETAVAGHARLLILATSEQPITGTVDGCFRTVSGLLFKAVRGGALKSFKHWCDAEIKRQDESENIVRILDPEGPPRNPPQDSVDLLNYLHRTRKRA